MAFTAFTIGEVQAGGSDTANGGLFDPSQTAGMNTDGAATSANTDSPVFTSASYTFLAGDVGAWLYIASGTNWIPGWYKIASVATGAATLSAAAGAAVLATGSIATRLSTTAGCATTASPTAATWTIDFSQQASAQFTYTDITTAGAGLTATSAGHPFGKQQVGNSIVLTSGTNITAGRYVLASVSGTTGTFIGAANLSTGASTNGAGGMGGALATPGQFAALFQNGPKGPDVFIKAGTYTTTTTSTNVAGGLISYNSINGGGVDRTNWCVWCGYNTTRFDDGTPPVYRCGGATTSNVVLLQGGFCMARNIKIDGNSTGCGGFFLGGGANNIAYRCQATGCTSATGAGVGVGGGHGEVINCYVTAGGVGFSTQNDGNAFVGCVATSCTVSGFSFNGTISYCFDCIAANCTGTTTDGFQGIDFSSTLVNCIAYTNGRHGFSMAVTASGAAFINCISYGNVNTGFSTSSVESEVFLLNCAVGGNATAYNTAQIFNVINLQTLTGNPFTSAGTGDFSLNSTAGAGALCKAAGFPGVFPGIASTGNMDIGAVQSGAGVAAVTRSYGFAG